MRLKIITPRKIVLEEEISAVIVPSAEGELTILPRHIHLLSLLKEGIITIKKKDNEDYLAIGGGYMETDGKEVNILVSRAYKQNEIDEHLTQKAIAEGKRILSESKERNDRFEATATIRRSLIDLKLLKKRRKTPGV
jgi:F-type H+-transporting ATPase subunit epsilon